MVIELFGGVGSGKSLVLRELKENWNAAVIGMDETAHSLYEKGRAGNDAAVRILGPTVRKPDGSLDRAAMADILYRDPERMHQLELVIHPLVYDEVARLVSEYRKTNGLVVVETALPKKEQSDIFDELWYVFTPEDIRETRLMRDRGYSKERVREIMAKQLSDSAFREMADFVLVNDGTEEELKEKIRKRLGGSVPGLA